MATFQKRKTKTKGQVWDVIFRFNDGPEIIQKKLSGFRTKRDAQRAYEDFIDNYEPASYAPDESPEKHSDILADVYNEYFTAMENTFSLQHMYVMKYAFKTHILPYFGTWQITDISRSDIIRWQEALWSKKTVKGTLYKQNTLNGVNQRFSSFMGWASERYSFANPFDGVTTPLRREINTGLHVWTVDQFNVFIEHLTIESHEIFFTLIFYSGCRKGEINALTVDDFIKNDDHYDIKISKSTSQVNGEGVVITPPKTASSNRTVSLPPSLTSALDEFLKGKTGFLWKRHLTSWNITFDRAVKRAGLPHIRIHDLRHSHASILIASGVPVPSVSKRLGHKSPTITLNTYTHPIDANEKYVLDLLDKLWEEISPNFE